MDTAGVLMVKGIIVVLNLIGYNYIKKGFYLQKIRLEENRSQCVCWVSTLVSDQLQMADYRRLGRGTKPSKRLPDLNPTYNNDVNTE